MSPAWDPTLRMTLHPHCLESSVPEGLETTAQASIVCLATQAAGQWGAAGGAAVKGREPRERMSWDNPACWAALTGHRGHCHCQVSGGAEGDKSSMERFVGWWGGSAPSCAKISTGKSAHLLGSAKSGPAVSQIPFTPSCFFPLTHSVTGAELTDGMKTGNNFSRAGTGTLVLLQFIQELIHPDYSIFTSLQDKPSTNLTLLYHSAQRPVPTQCVWAGWHVPRAGCAV